MPKLKAENEGVERVTLKLPKSIAQYFRITFPHGQRSDFVARQILRYQHEQEVKEIEERLRQAGNSRQ